LTPSPFLTYAIDPTSPGARWHRPSGMKQEACPSLSRRPRSYDVEESVRCGRSGWSCRRTRIVSPASSRHRRPPGLDVASTTCLYPFRPVLHSDLELFPATLEPWSVPLHTHSPSDDHGDAQREPDLTGAAVQRHHGRIMWPL